MIVTGPWELYPMVQAKTPYAVTILPGTNGDHQTISGPDIWAAFDHKDANRAHWTFQLLNWMSQPEQDARVEHGSGQPAAACLGDRTRPPMPPSSRTSRGWT